MNMIKGEVYKIFSFVTNNFLIIFRLWKDVNARIFLDYLLL